MKYYFAVLAIAAFVLGSLSGLRPAVAQSKVHEWKFEGGFLDTSGSNNHGVGRGTFVPGRFGQGLRMSNIAVTGGALGDGVDTTAPASNLPVAAASSWSMNFWLAVDPALPLGPLEYIAGFGNDRTLTGVNGSTRAALAFHPSAAVDPQQNNFHFWGYNVDVISGVDYAADGAWHMYTITYDGADLRMFQDAVERASAPAAFTNAQPEVHVGNPSIWNNNLDASIDEFTIFSGMLSLAQVQGLYLLNDINGSFSNLAFEINRSTGAATLVNNSANDLPNIITYTISSPAGALKPGAWQTIAGRLDGAGDGSIDDGIWLPLSDQNASLSIELSETVLGTDGGTLAGGESIDFGPVWAKSPFEDMSIDILVDDGVAGAIVTIPATFADNGGQGYAKGDYDGDNDIDAVDWQLFRSASVADLSLATPAAAYFGGDLDGDSDKDLFDFDAFAALYDAANGAGAFASLAVPEPSATWLAMLAALPFLAPRNTSTPRRSCSIRKGMAAIAARVVVGVAFAALAFQWTPRCLAQTTLIDSSITVRLEPIITSGLNGVLAGNTFNNRKQYIPADMTPLGDGRQLILTLGGHVRLLQPNGTLAPGAYLDTNNVNSPSPTSTDFTQIGNTSIAAHPGFLDPGSRGYGRFYTITSEKDEIVPADFEDGVSSVMDSVVYEWSVAPSAITGATQLTIAGSGQNVVRREIMRSQRPGIIHTLVDMAFGPDEYLYLTSGDGGGNAFPNTNGSAFNQDRWTNALDPRNIFGSVLRIDPLDVPGDSRPTGGQNNQYRVHPQNVGVTDGVSETHAETFAFGFRSPYRINVDQATGDVFIGDVGETQREEVDRIRLAPNGSALGVNYGWGAYEGTTVERADLTSMAVSAVNPHFELLHNLNGQSEAVNVVGGFVYRGSAIPQLAGKYVFADTGENEYTQPTNVLDLFVGDPNSTGASTRDDLFRLRFNLPPGVAAPDRIWSIAEDEEGELYLLVGPKRNDLFDVSPGETDGGVWKIVGPPGPPNGLAGDVNQDGLLNGDDVLALKGGWYTTGHSSVFDQYTHGDLNLDSRTDIKDSQILHRALLDASQAAAVQELRQAVPEPPASALIVTALASIGLLRLRCTASTCRPS